MKRRVKAVYSVALSAAVLMGWAGCRSASWQPSEEFRDTITHAGTIADLARGRYDGFFAVSNLTRYGDHGLGTFDRLDGEMIMHRGRVYRCDADGHVAEAPPDATTPYAVVTYFNPDRIFDIESVDQRRFERALGMRRDHDLPEAIEVLGTFAFVQFRSVPAQEAPYQPLAPTLQSASRIFTLTNVAGTMAGYYFPEDLAALHPEGYHFHFMDAPGARGGHVLDFAINQARIAVDTSPNIQVFLPTNRPVIRTFHPIRPPPARR